MGQTFISSLSEPLEAEKGEAKPEDKAKEPEVEPEKKVTICVLRCSSTGRVLYVEAYKDFVDLLLGFLSLRTGSVIKLIHEVAPAMKQLKNESGICNVYGSLQKLDDSLLHVDKELLLDPVQRLRISEEMLALENHDFECCNAECPKHMASSRQICRNCTISTHFSCITCGRYYPENAHTSLCNTPWRPWGNHSSAAPILTRYTVIQSCPPTTKAATKDDPGSKGYVKSSIPFIITDELHITDLSTCQISQLLKKFGVGSCEDLECNKLAVGPSEVVMMLGAAMTSPTPLTDVFGSMCKNHTRVFSSASFSSMPPIQENSTSDKDQIMPPAEKLRLSKTSLLDQKELPDQNGLQQLSLQKKATSHVPPASEILPQSRQSSLKKLSRSDEPPRPQPDVPPGSDVALRLRHSSLKKLSRSDEAPRRQPSFRQSLLKMFTSSESEPTDQPTGLQLPVDRPSASTPPGPECPASLKRALSDTSEQPLSTETNHQPSQEDDGAPQQQQPPPPTEPNLYVQQATSERQEPQLVRQRSSWLKYIRQSAQQNASDDSPILPVSSKSIVNPLFQQACEAVTNGSLPQFPVLDVSLPPPLGGSRPGSVQWQQNSMPPGAVQWPQDNSIPPGAHQWPQDNSIPPGASRWPQDNSIPGPPDAVHWAPQGNSIPPGAFQWVENSNPPGAVWHQENQMLSSAATQHANFIASSGDQQLQSNFNAVEMRHPNVRLLRNKKV